MFHISFLLLLPVLKRVLFCVAGAFLPKMYFYSRMYNGMRKKIINVILRFWYEYQYCLSTVNWSPTTVSLRKNTIPFESFDRTFVCFASAGSKAPVRVT